ncbi:MAG: sulfurtransferase TusA family protein [Candidatus Oleimicrobiaceae bacterium]
MPIQPDETLDCIGLYCPMPILMTAEKIARMAPGQVLEIISDDRGIRTDMPAWCESTGHELLGLEQKGEEFHVYVRKRSG